MHSFAVFRHSSCVVIVMRSNCNHRHLFRASWCPRNIRSQKLTRFVLHLLFHVWLVAWLHRLRVLVCIVVWHWDTMKAHLNACMACTRSNHVRHGIVSKQRHLGVEVQSHPCPTSNTKGIVSICLWISLTRIVQRHRVFPVSYHCVFPVLSHELESDNLLGSTLGTFFCWERLRSSLLSHISNDMLN